MCHGHARHVAAEEVPAGKLKDPGSSEAVLRNWNWTVYVCAALSASNVSLEVNMPLCRKREERAKLY